jgi:hypothetical protein
MPIQLKNRDSIPKSDYATVNILGLDIPLTDQLPFGAQVELIDLQAQHADGAFGQYEYLMRIFCVFTRRLPKGEQVRYEWLAAQDLEADEVTQLVTGTLQLLTHQQAARASVAEGKARAKAPKAS